MDVRKVYPHADYAGGLTIFNAGGNKNRLVTRISYGARSIQILEVLTHAEYDRKY